MRGFRSVQTWQSSRNVINVCVCGVVPRACLALWEKTHLVLMTSRSWVIMRSHCALIVTRVATRVKWKLSSRIGSHYYAGYWLEVNKCTFTFLSEISSEIWQIQCTRTEFWCIQCLRPAGLSALDKHQIQASALDLSYFTNNSKCKFIKVIHTRQKNKIICSFSWQIINEMALKWH